MIEQAPTAQEIEAPQAIAFRLRGYANNADSNGNVRMYMAAREYHAIADALSSLSHRLGEAERQLLTNVATMKEAETIIERLRERATAAEARLAKCQEYIAATEHWQLDPHDAKERTAFLNALDASEPPHDGGEIGSKG